MLLTFPHLAERFVPSRKDMANSWNSEPVLVAWERLPVMRCWRGVWGSLGWRKEGLGRQGVSRWGPGHLMELPWAAPALASPVMVFRSLHSFSCLAQSPCNNLGKYEQSSTWWESYLRNVRNESEGTCQRHSVTGSSLQWPQKRLRCLFLVRLTQVFFRLPAARVCICVCDPVI